MKNILGFHPPGSFAVQNCFPAVLWWQQFSEARRKQERDGSRFFGLLFFGETKKSDSPKGDKNQKAKAGLLALLALWASLRLFKHNVLSPLREDDDSLL